MTAQRSNLGGLRISMNSASAASSSSKPTPPTQTAGRSASGRTECEWVIFRICTFPQMKKYLVPTYTHVMLWFLPATLYAPRVWTHSILPNSAVIQFGANVGVRKESAENTYSLTTTLAENEPVLIRQGKKGPILGVTEVKSARFRSDDLI